MEAKIEWIKNHRRELMAGFAVLAVIILIIGLCLSWFVYTKSLSTVGMLKQPSDIRLMGPNATEMSQIDLSYDPKTDVHTDEKTGKKIVELRRALCVKTEKPNTAYTLFLARTTNIDGLNIKLYKATDVTKSEEAAKADVTGYDGINKYYAWNKDGSELLKDWTPLNKLNDELLADPSKDDKTFGKNLGVDLLQRHASPVYWRSNGTFNSGDDSVDRYIIEFSWEETQKETDVIYLIANSAGASANN